MIYLATPYTHPDPDVMAERAFLAAIANAHLLRLGFNVYSSIAHCHPLNAIAKLPSDWGYWGYFCEDFVVKCDSLWVYQMPGWKTSKGVDAEIEIARKHRKPIFVLPYTEAWHRVKEVIPPFAGYRVPDFSPIFLVYEWAL